MSLSKIAIIGTGITALSIGHYLPLVNPLVEITFFDKGQKPGGRVATRRSRQNQQLLFDHGAPFLWEDNIKGEFRKVLDELNAVKQVGINLAKAQSLQGNNKISQISKNVLIGKNGLDSVPEMIFKSIKNVKAGHFQHRVTQVLETKQKQLYLKFEQVPNKIPANKEIGSFNQVFCCIPFPQAKSIKQQIFSFEPYAKNQSAYNAHWIVLLSVKKGELFGEYKDTDVIEFSSKESPIKYAVKQNKKFEKIQNSDSQNWAIYFTEQWTEENLNLKKEQIQQKFMKQLLPLCSSHKQQLNPSFVAVHRWLYSSPKLTDIKSELISEDKRLIFAGDWVGNQQSVGECWQLGKEIVERMYGKGDSGNGNKSKL